MRNAALKAREIESDVYLPFGRHVTDTVISLSTRALITVIRIDGTSFETAETADLNDLHAKLNLTLRNVADDRLALWTHLVRRQTSDYPNGAFRSRFAAVLNIASGFAAKRCFATTSTSRWYGIPAARRRMQRQRSSSGSGAPAGAPSRLTARP
jgi:type IV secretory pathway VirB4 component